MTELRRTPLTALHRRLGARLVPFAGFEMPVAYGSILEEHAAVREHAGLFDVSHMGEIHLTGEDAVARLERLVSCPVATLRPGHVRYGLLCNEAGGVVDDVTVYRLDEHAFFVCVNAANVEKDRRWIEEHTAGGRVRVDDRSPETALLALQGPASPAILARTTSLDVRRLRRFRFVEGTVAGTAALVSRTGYTGSDGYELFLAAKDAERAFEALLEEGAGEGLRPAGLGARDTLRLEAALPLYGQELDEATSPLEAGLERFVKLDAGGFVGAEALRRRSQAPLSRRLVGFVLEDRGVARTGYALLHDAERVGTVTSGGPSPTLGKSIGLGYVPPALAAAGTRLTVQVRARGVPVRVVETPFVRFQSATARRASP